jgi:hypothetical protein
MYPADSCPTGKLNPVQRRRDLPTRLIQYFQDILLEFILTCDRPTSTRLAPGQSAEQLAPMRALRTRMFAFGGFAPEHSSI